MIYFSGNIGSFVAATTIGWSSPMVEKLQGLEDNPLGRRISESETSLLASLSILGSVMSCIIISIFGSKFGRKTFLVSQGVIVLFSYLLMAWVTSVWLLYLYRFVSGIGVGCILTVMLIYFGELAEAKNRGMIGTSVTAAMNAGVLFSYTAGSYLNFFDFHIALAAISAIFTIIFFMFAPESPYFTIKYDKTKAKDVLAKLREEKNLDKSLNEIEESILHHHKVPFMEIFKSKASIKTFIIGIGGFTFRQLTGESIFVSYAQTFLKEAGDRSPEKGPILITIIQLFVSLLVPLLADRFSRKSLLVVSHAGITLCLIPLGVYFHLKESNCDGIENVSWLPLICLILLSSFFNIGIAPVMMTLMGELFPLKTKNVIVSFLTAYNLATSFLITLMYKNIKDAIHEDNLVWILAACGCGAVVFVKCFMVETRGKTLQEIQDELETRYN